MSIERELLRELRDAREAFSRLATMECRCMPETGQCRKGEAAEIELEERLAFAAERVKHIDAYLSTPVAESAPVAASAEPVAKVVATAPESIWLQVCVDCDGSDCAQEPFPSNHDGITWCQDSIGGVQVEYVRADTHPAAIREVSDEDVRVALGSIPQSMMCWIHPDDMRTGLKSFRERLNAELRGERKEGE
jgi:hypothetical protein